MTHGTLSIYRSQFDGVEVNHDGELLALAESEAQDYYERDLAGSARRRHDTALAANRLAQKQFIDSITVRFGVESDDPVARTLRAGERVDQVLIDGEVVEMYAGRGQRYVQALAERKFPVPEPPRLTDFASWWNEEHAELAVWNAQFVTASGSEPITVAATDRSGPRFPIRLALAELDRLRSDGWALVHVSEDRGVRDEAGSTGEAFVVHARYLVSR